MRTRLVGWLVLLALGAAGGAATVSLTLGQPPQPPKFPPAATPQPLPPLSTTPLAPATPSDSGVKPAEATRPAGPTPPPMNLSQLPLLTRQMTLVAQRGAEWLNRVNLANGRFVYGMIPALNAPMEGDHYLAQAGATFALARAARFTGDQRYTVRARQAVLSLLAETKVGAADPNCRYPIFPSIAVNRLAAAGLIVAAMHELPAPANDLLDRGEQLCQFIRKQQRPDGSFRYCDNPSDDPLCGFPEGINTFPGVALHGLMLSQRHRPAAWKDEAVRRALDYYRAWWTSHKALAFVSTMTAAFTEAYLKTKDEAYARFVLEMNDWLCGFQYDRVDSRHPLWRGGFMGCADGQPVNQDPTIETANCAEALAEACRVARQLPDVERYERYRACLTRALQFLTTLQYTEDTTQHFAASFRPIVLGGFHASLQDGNLRVDYAQHAVSALVQYLTYSADRK